MIPRPVRTLCRVATAVVLLHCLGGCGKREQHAEEHAEEHAPTGPHGGAVVTLVREAVEQARIESDVAGPRPIAVTVELPGEVKLDAERRVELRPTYPGVVRVLHKRLGDPVSEGEVVAVIRSSESLSDYELTAPIGGQIVTRDAAVGQSVDPQSLLYTIADLSRVWVDFPIYRPQQTAIRTGQEVRISAEGSGRPPATAAISYVGPLLDERTRTTYGRAVLDNRAHRWQPGLLVTATVVTDRTTAAVAVPEEAVVRMGHGVAVFRALSDSTFEVQIVTVGRSDGVLTEIVSGLEPGARVVVRNAFLLQAELGKAEGGHED